MQTIHPQTALGATQSSAHALQRKPMGVGLWVDCVSALPADREKLSD